MKYIDLAIEDNDLTLGGGGEPSLLGDQDSIVQDIKHLIRDSGLLVEMIGQRDVIKIQALVQKLELMIEEDVRLVPGTVSITKKAVGLFFVTATTVEFGVFNFELSVGESV
jgi:hypothetical protein